MNGLDQARARAKALRDASAAVIVNDLVPIQNDMAALCVRLEAYAGDNPREVGALEAANLARLARLTFLNAGAEEVAKLAEDADASEAVRVADQARGNLP